MNIIYFIVDRSWNFLTTRTSAHVLRIIIQNHNDLRGGRSYIIPPENFPLFRLRGFSGRLYISRWLFIFYYIYDFFGRNLFSRPRRAPNRLFVINSHIFGTFSGKRYIILIYMPARRISTSRGAEFGFIVRR